MSLSDRIQDIQSRIEAAMKRSSFGPREITLMGASKGQSVELIREAYSCGIRHMGENYVQEVLKKAPLCQDLDISWHFIGHLQSNKAKHLLPFVSSIDSIDSLELGQKISRQQQKLEAHQKKQAVLIQVNLGHEKQKSGLVPEVVENLFDDFLDIKEIEIRGLMCIPPMTQDEKRTRMYFQQTKGLFDKLKKRHKEPALFKSLSMGMSSDFEIAIEEGSNCVRIGEALFGPRGLTPKRKSVRFKEKES